MRRKVLSISQAQLATELGMTFQQVQKYERGSNRISASKLYKAARVLQVAPSYFFSGLPQPDEPGQPDPDQDQQRTVHQFLMTPEGPELARLVSSLSETTRSRFFNVLWSLTSDEAAN